MTLLILRYGTIAGLIVAVPMVWRMLTLDASQSTEPLGGMLVGYLTMIVALTAVFIGVKQYRDRLLGGTVRFLPAFGVGLAISSVACLFYVLGWEISMAFSEFDFSQYYANYMIEAARAKGGSPADLARAAADGGTFIEMFPVGLLVSVISAAVLRNSRILRARV
jgi:hypothetical protein